MAMIARLPHLMAPFAPLCLCVCVPLCLCVSVQRWHWMMVAGEVLSVVSYAASFVLLPTYFDLPYLLTLSFWLKVSLSLALSLRRTADEPRTGQLRIGRQRTGRQRTGQQRAGQHNSVLVNSEPKEDAPRG